MHVGLSSTDGRLEFRQRKRDVPGLKMYDNLQPQLFVFAECEDRINAWRLACVSRNLQVHTVTHRREAGEPQL
jgi:hypothetical protein